MGQLTMKAALVQDVDARAPCAEAAITFEELFQRYAPFVLRNAKRFGVTEADADDVAQDVFVVVHRRLSHLRADANPQSWVFGILRRVASDYRKRARRRPRHVEVQEFHIGQDQGHGPESAIAQKQLRALLHAGLDQLDDTQREVFVLYELEGLRMPEVCECIGCPLQTGYWRLKAARKTVQAFILARVGKEGIR